MVFPSKILTYLSDLLLFGISYFTDKQKRNAHEQCQPHTRKPASQAWCHLSWWQCPHLQSGGLRTSSTVCQKGLKFLLFSWNTFQGNMFYKNMHKLPKRWKEKKAAATNQWAEEKKKCLKCLIIKSHLKSLSGWRGRKRRFLCLYVKVWDLFVDITAM